MKTIYGSLIITILLAVTVPAQQMYFCEGVTSDGYPLNSSDVFTIPKDGGYLYVLVKLSYSIECNKVTYFIYNVDSYGNKSFDNSFYQDVNRNFNWFWRQVTFYKPGLYEIEVYDCYDYKVASGRLRIQY
ncbi:Hypothetical protein IALB_2006 [Ignavibacterium album JCM 16511]|uniref:Uncharacterized protein n=1 Tax=Ignavibacterium album (strain DSM 19864 / JCM 16511 / NBRC 101810 / Mat9-16) TaxID=945713 RepID=I0AL54_IGNAJ|nr:hypothetical protein [Ignavibacterium album]AFH49711.1 Hypothetical protein IALB_2006 [Ignavibacterium album JCM 16511]